MANKKTCPACGAPVSPGDEFCGFCGALIPRNKAVGQTEQASAAAVQAAPAAEGVLAPGVHQLRLELHREDPGLVRQQPFC